MAIERLGKPGVYVTIDNFMQAARSGAADEGMPGLRIVAPRADEYYRGRVSLVEIRPVAARIFGEIIGGLTRPLTEDESNPKPVAKEVTEKTINVTAENNHLASERVNQVFLENRWSDGLPLVPPTLEAVRWMLTGTSRPPDEVIGAVAPKRGMATIEKIAINSVMAGAKPEYLPVILAAMEGFLDRNYDLGHVTASTGSFIPIIVVNGPMARELDMNSGIGFLGHGWRANSTIGRAIRLCWLNLGHTWPAENDMALVGRLASYTFFTFAENELQSPWEPYHVSLGFKPEDSTVTVSTVAGSYSSAGGGAVIPWTGQGILDRIISTVSWVSTYAGGVYSMKHVIAFHPECATELAQKGFTRKSLQEWLYENSRVPYDRLSPSTIKEVQLMVDDRRIRPDRIPVFKEALTPGGKIPIVQSPDDFKIIVVGGVPGYTLQFYYGGPNWAHQTKKIRGATLTRPGR